MMKTMFSLSQLATMLDTNHAAKADFMVPASSVNMGDSAQVSIAKGPYHEVRPIGHGQIAEYTGIPKAYYDRMLGADKPLLAHNVNHWLGTKGDERRLVSYLNGELRALLSDRYQRIDNKEVAEVVLNILASIPGVKVRSCAITESRMYVKAVTHEVTAAVPGSRRVGDVIAAGVCISNSEVGMGAVSVKGFIECLWCVNGMTRDDSKMRANHVGRRADESIEGLLSDNTRRLEDELVLRKVRDVIAHCFDAVQLQMLANRMGKTTQQQIEGKVEAAVEALGPSVGLLAGERESVLRHLIAGGDLSRWGLINAVTRTAEDVESYDRATEIETIGFRLLDMTDPQWNQISRAKPLALAA